jgi:hypothetical protein
MGRGGQGRKTLREVTDREAGNGRFEGVGDESRLEGGFGSKEDGTAGVGPVIFSEICVSECSCSGDAYQDITRWAAPSKPSFSVPPLLRIMRWRPCLWTIHSAGSPARHCFSSAVSFSKTGNLDRHTSRRVIIATATTE